MVKAKRGKENAVKSKQHVGVKGIKTASSKNKPMPSSHSVISAKKGSSSHHGNETHNSALPVANEEEPDAIISPDEYPLGLIQHHQVAVDR